MMNLLDEYDLIVIGAGIAGCEAALSFARLLPGSSVLLINGEALPPYKRTKLSKDLASLYGEQGSAAGSAFPPLPLLDELTRFGVTMVNARVQKILRHEKRLLLVPTSGPDATDETSLAAAGQSTSEFPAGMDGHNSPGTRAPADGPGTSKNRAADGEQGGAAGSAGNASSPAYRRLVIATGARALDHDVSDDLPPGIPHYRFREAGDARHILDGLREHRDSRVLILGDGIMAVELAEQLALIGSQVTMLGGEEGTPMHRELNEFMRRDLLERMDAAGISYHHGQHPDYRGWTAIISARGSRPRMELAADAGLPCKRGLLVDAGLRTGDPDIWAAGDVCELKGRVVHLWHHSEYLGTLAGRNAAASLAHSEISGSSDDPGEQVDGRLFRTKCAVFGQYYFSAVDFPDTLEEHTGGGLSRKKEFHRDGRYWEVFLSVVESCTGARMMGDDKAGGKLLQKAVFEHWPLQRIEEEIINRNPGKSD